MLAAEVGNVNAAPGGIIGPAVVTTLDRAILDHSMRQRHLTVSATVLEREK
jgi:hypothetical protein